VSGIEHALTQMISNWYLTGGYLGIVLAMAIESCCIPLPSELVMPIAGFFVVQHPDRFSLLGVALAGGVGCALGSLAAYGIGRAGGRPLLLKYGRYILISQADSDRADDLFARHGGAVAFFSRLLPVVRTYISLPAGIAKMDVKRFVAYTLAGSLPWCLALAWVGTKVGEHSSQLASIFHGLDAVIAVALVAAVVWYVRRHLRQDHAARAVLAMPGTGSRERPANPAPAARGRPRRLPASPLPNEDRPTIPMESVSAWPNRFARPVQRDEPPGRSRGRE
jgi:membrane protein DedA with SNARE-associated domain